MNMPPPPEHETPEERFERISKMPGVIVHRRVGPPQPFVPTLRVREGLTVKEILVGMTKMTKATMCLDSLARSGGDLR